jgi:transposase-like protein
MNFFELLEKYPSQEAVIQHFILIRYKNQTPYCHECGAIDRIVPNKERPKVFHCNHCNSSFSVFKGTIFEKSKTDLRKWMYAIHLFLNAKKGVSGYQLQREIGVMYKTAWRMLRQIRLAMSNTEMPEFTKTIIEIDETYVGGKPKRGNRPADGSVRKRGRGTKKTPVVGVIDRQSKKVYARVALPNKEGKSLTGKQLLSILSDVARGPNTVMTDEFRSYGILKTTDHIHFKIDHSKMYADGIVHTNNIENFWSNFKRGVLGIYHHVSKKYLQAYIDEFSFRYNNRSNDNIFEDLLRQCVFNNYSAC